MHASIDIIIIVNLEVSVLVLYTLVHCQDSVTLYKLAVLPSPYFQILFPTILW